MGKWLTDPKEKDVIMLWHRIRNGLTFGITVIASPCCAPLFVPLILALLAGTPAAIWLTYHTGWVYGGLTLVSIVSLVLGLRWMRQNKLAKYTPLVLPSKPISRPLEVSKIN